MAKVKFGAIITDSRGKIGGTILKLGRWGVELRRSSLPRAARTARQMLQGALLSATSPLWTEDLTESERQAWRDLAATQDTTDQWGATYPLTGIALFTRVNTQRMAAGLSPLITAPADQAVTSPTLASLTITAGPTLTVAWTPNPAPANHRVKIWLTPPMSAGTSVAQHRYLLIDTSSAAPSSPLDVSAEYLAVFSGLSSGKKVYGDLAFWNQTTGALSPKLPMSDVM